MSAKEPDHHATEKPGARILGRGSVAITAQAIAPLLAATQIFAGALVLDVGCGEGRAAAAAAEQGALVWAVDIAGRPLEAAARRYPAVAFACADAGRLPFADQSFDAVISNFGMPHFPDADGFLREAFRVLRPEGVIAFTAWVDPTQEDAPAADDPPLASNEFFRFGEITTCRRALGNAGFDSVRIETAHVAWRSAAASGFIEAIMTGLARIAEPLDAEAEATLRHALQSRAQADGGAEVFELPLPMVIASARRTGPSVP